MAKVKDESKVNNSSTKKKDIQDDRQFLGKLEKNSCSVGIVGLPNIGKSSLFNAFGSQQVAAENYPFCTIEPSQITVPVHDKRWDHLCKSFKPKSKIKAVLTIWDIAGLVKGAHTGKGLGNNFLANIQAVDAIYHVVRAFRDKKVEHVDGSLDPVRDMEVISNELRQKDLAVMSNKLENLERHCQRANQDKKAADELKYLRLVVECLKNGKDVANQRWDNKAVYYLQQYNLFTGKPVVFLVNVSEKNWLTGSNKFILDIQKWVKEHYPYSPVIPFSAKFELKLCKMDKKERKKYLKDNKTKSALNKIIHAGYKALNLQHFFTCGEDEVRAWTIRKGLKAPQAAGVIHTDMEQGFICAEVYNYDDFNSLGSEQACKDKGKYRQQGKNYIVQDGDICFFKFNKPKQKDKKKK